MNKDVVKMIERIVWQRLMRNQNDEYRELYKYQDTYMLTIPRFCFIIVNYTRVY